jgi:hypothetical protein
VPNGTSMNEPKLWLFRIKATHFDLWYKENSRRLSEMARIPYDFSEWSEYRKYIKDYPCFDIDESIALWQMSKDHLIEILKFLWKMYD